MTPTQLPLIEGLVDEPVVRKPRVNCLQEILLEVMNERKLTLAEIQKGTGISWATIISWHEGTYNSQRADKNLLKLAQFLNLNLSYLLFGIGDESPLVEKFNNPA